MRKANFSEQFDIGSLADSEAGCRPFSDPVDREERRLFEGGAEKGAGSMREMVFAEKDSRPGYPEPLLDQVFNPQLVAKPGDHCLAKNPMRAWKGLQAG